MLSKLILIMILAAEIFVCQKVLASSCPGWIKLNKSPVCFGAKGDQFGRFKYDRNIFVRSIMFVHRSGTVTCSSSIGYSYWGCAPNTPNNINTMLTDENNKILAPSKEGASLMAGYTSSSSIVVFCAQKKPLCVLENSELRLWYWEDLVNSQEGDNGGKTCADVYALPA